MVGLPLLDAERVRGFVDGGGLGRDFFEETEDDDEDEDEDEVVVVRVPSSHRTSLAHDWSRSFLRLRFFDLRELALMLVALEGDEGTEKRELVSPQVELEAEASCSPDDTKAAELRGEVGGV